MRRLFSALLVFGLIAMSSCQKAGGSFSNLYGSWRSSSVTQLDGNTIEYEEIVYTFSKGEYETDFIGVLYSEEWGQGWHDTGTFYYDQEKNQLLLDIIELGGAFEIVSLSNKRLVLKVISSHFWKGIETITFAKL